MRGGIKFWIANSFVGVVSFLLAACIGGVPAQQIEVTRVVEVTRIVIVTATPEKAVALETVEPTLVMATPLPGARDNLGNSYAVTESNPRVQLRELKALDEDGQFVLRLTLQSEDRSIEGIAVTLRVYNTAGELVSGTSSLAEQEEGRFYLRIETDIPIEQVERYRLTW